MSERDDKADLQTKIRLINPLAYTHSGPPFGNCDRCGKASAPYVGVRLCALRRLFLRRLQRRNAGY